MLERYQTILQGENSQYILEYEIVMTTSELSASGETYGLRAILENCSDGDRNEAIVADISSDPDEVRERAKQYLQAGVTPSTLPDVVLDTLGR